MSKIKILSEQLANQIAAGEVVERPASVVKELVENAIDAGAGRIEVHVEGHGTRLLKVLDNGTGMDGDDLLLCLERHATSKLRDADGLTAIDTLGFRGEAIPSIASVSRLAITSRPREQPLGNRAEVRYGKLVQAHETGCNQGTLLEVRDLFANVPARRKFLKSGRTETGHIEETVKNYGLAYPEIGFTCTLEGRTVLRWAPGATLEQRVHDILTPRAALPLIRVGSGPEDDRGSTASATAPPEGVVHIRGLLLPPDETTSLRAGLKIFVNRRAIRDRMVAHAVQEGMRNFLMKGRAPAGVIFIDLEPADIDVNVHPTKQEIRFRHSNRVHGQVTEAVRRAMERRQREMQNSLFGVTGQRSARPQSGPAADTVIAAGPAALERHRPESRPDPRPDPKSDSRPDFRPDRPSAPRPSATPRPMPWPRSPEPGPADLQAGEPGPRFQADRVTTPFFEPTLSSPAPAGAAVTGPPASRVFPPAPAAGPGPPDTLTPIGQLLDLYILCQSHEGPEPRLVVIDQHAAHERILFEELRRQYLGRQVAGQTLLFPALVELDPAQGELVERHGPELARLGLTIEPFGDSTYVIKAIPALLARVSPEEILADLLRSLGDLGPTAGAEEGTEQGGGRVDELLASMACKSAIKAGRSLEPVEIEKLLHKMRESNAFSHCPHGRPVVKTFTAAEIRKWFHRT